MQDFEMEIRLESHLVTPEEKQTLDAWGELFIEARKKIGRSFDTVRGDKMKERMEAVGFVDIAEKKIMVPCGYWPIDPRVKHADVLIQASIQESLDGLAMYLSIEVLGWKADEVTVLVAKMQNMVNGRRIVPTLMRMFSSQQLPSRPTNLS